MALTQARTMPGVMELLPLDQIAFQRMLEKIRRNFERFGFSVEHARAFGGERFEARAVFHF